MSHRLAGIDQERYVGRPRQRADLGRRVHQPAVGRDVRERHEGDVAATQRVGHRCHRHLTRLVAPNPFDDDAVLLDSAEEGDRVGAVLVVVHEDPLPRRHRHRPERRVPSRRRVLEAPDLVWPGVEQPGDRTGHRIEIGGTLIRQLVSADGRLALQVLELGVDHHPRRQRRAGVVEVDLVEFRCAPRRHRPGMLDLDVGQRRCVHGSLSIASSNAFSTTSVSAGWM